MAQMFSQLVARLGFEQAVAISVYVGVVLAFVIAMLGQIGWTVSRRMIRYRRLSRELRLLHAAAYRERPRRGSYVA